MMTQVMVINGPKKNEKKYFPLFCFFYIFFFFLKIGTISFDELINCQCMQSEMTWQDGRGDGKNRTIMVPLSLLKDLKLLFTNYKTTISVNQTEQPRTLSLIGFILSGVCVDNFSFSFLLFLSLTPHHPSLTFFIKLWKKKKKKKKKKNDYGCYPIPPKRL